MYVVWVMDGHCLDFVNSALESVSGVCVTLDNSGDGEEEYNGEHLTLNGG